VNAHLSGSPDQRLHGHCIAACFGVVGSRFTTRAIAEVVGLTAVKEVMPSNSSTNFSRSTDLCGML
jgi:hypothetical protein